MRACVYGLWCWVVGGGGAGGRGRGGGGYWLQECKGSTVTSGGFALVRYSICDCSGRNPVFGKHRVRALSAEKGKRRAICVLAWRLAVNAIG
jgi:hypothetical protein